MPEDPITITLNAQSLPAPTSGAEVPDWIHLLPPGPIQTGDRRGPYSLIDAEAVARASLSEGDRLPIDENHATDLAAPKGTPILATADGVVTFAGTFSSYGKLVKIKHDFGYETRYGHLSKIRVKKGQRVSRGEAIGGMGNTGRSTGTHLHYELRYKGKALNPMNYIKAAKDVF